MFARRWTRPSTLMSSSRQNRRVQQRDGSQASGGIEQIIAPRPIALDAEGDSQSALDGASDHVQERIAQSLVFNLREFSECAIKSIASMSKVSDAGAAPAAQALARA